MAEETKNTPQKKKQGKSESTKPQSAKAAPKKKKSSAGSVILVILLLAGIGAGGYFASKALRENAGQQAQTDTAEGTLTTPAETTETTVVTTTTARFPAKAESTTETLTVDDASKIYAQNFALIECGEDGNTLLAEHDADAEIYPASMTKMMTLVTFMEMIDEEALDDAILMDANVVAEMQEKQMAVADFEAGEPCTIRDLLYAMMLPSGADAAVMLATYVSGSEEAFAEQMNSLAAEMGLEHSHFVNCTGMHDTAHISSINDMARILMYAMQNPVCREVMSTLQYTTASTIAHPEGITLTSTTLSRMVGNELEGLTDPLHVKGGKTGFTQPAGQCLATWAESDSGRTYVCVVAGSSTFQPLDAVGDVLTLYELTDLPLESIARIQPDEADLPLYEHY